MQYARNNLSFQNQPGRYAGCRNRTFTLFIYSVNSSSLWSSMSTSPPPPAPLAFYQQPLYFSLSPWAKRVTFFPRLLRLSATGRSVRLNWWLDVSPLVFSLRFVRKWKERQATDIPVLEASASMPQAAAWGCLSPRPPPVIKCQHKKDRKCLTPA